MNTFIKSSGILLMGMVLTMILTALFVVEVKAERLQITNDGPVAAYFAGSTAGYDSTMYVVAGGLYEPPQVLPVFDNHGVWFGTENILGSFSAGDYFQPVLLVHTTGEAWWGNPSSNSDGLGHMIATGLTLDNGTHGVLVRFEDLAGGGDLDFDDHMVFFTNVSVVPEPSTYLMLLLGLCIVFAVRHSFTRDDPVSDELTRLSKGVR